jgi:hypothetical protein
VIVYEPPITPLKTKLPEASATTTAPLLNIIVAKAPPAPATFPDTLKVVVRTEEKFTPLTLAPFSVTLWLAGVNV